LGVGSRKTEAGRPKQGEWKPGTKRGKPEKRHQDPFIKESNLKNPAVQDATLSLYITLNSRHKARILRVCLNLLFKAFRDGLYSLGDER
jgi:hypothetical protein